MLFPVMEKQNGNKKKQASLFKMQFKKLITGVVLFISTTPFCLAQVHWVNVDSLFSPLPASVHVFKTTDSIDGKPNIAFYVIADLKDHKLNFTTDTTLKRRFTPSQFFTKNEQPIVVVNGTFFEFETNRNLNTVVKNSRIISYNQHSIPLKGKDTLKYLHSFRSAIGISKKREPDVAWLFSDTILNKPFASQKPIPSFRDSSKQLSKSTVFIKASEVRMKRQSKSTARNNPFKPWNMQTAIGGGPVLVQNHQPFISNNDEVMFTGKAIDDRHPRTAMGYTDDHQLIILVVQGRFPNIAEGASLKQMAEILVSLGCKEALNLDGGGSSCLLVNGKETISPSDKTGQRPVPAVFLIKMK